MNGHPKRILLLGRADYRLQQGIERFAREQHWHVAGNLAGEQAAPRGWEGDGILSCLHPGHETTEFIENATAPAVDFGMALSCFGARVARVLEDHAHAARLVAEHFLARNFTRFIYYSHTDDWACEERGRSFVQVLRHSAYDCRWLRWRWSFDLPGREQWRQRRRWLASCLEHVPKPVALFGANDEHALEAFEACNVAGCRVPEEVAIVGAQNDLLAPDARPVPLSSVDTNLAAVGYAGAQLLGELMHGRRIPQRPIRVPAAGVVTRRSSDFLCPQEFHEHECVVRGLSGPQSEAARLATTGQAR